MGTAASLGNNPNAILTEEQGLAEQDLKDQFDLVDTDSSGFVDHKELRTLLKNTAASMTNGGLEDVHIETATEYVMNRFDDVNENDGRLSFAEFCELAKLLYNKAAAEVLCANLNRNMVRAWKGLKDNIAFEKIYRRAKKNSA